MTRICNHCSTEYTTTNQSQRYCRPLCASRAAHVKDRRRKVARNCAATFAVMGAVSDNTIGWAQAAWEYSTVYSQPCPMGQSLHN